MVKWQEETVTINLPMNNIKRRNTLRLWLTDLKLNKRVFIESIEAAKSKIIGLRYLLIYQEGNISVRVLLSINGAYKVWKDIEVPLRTNQLWLEIAEFGNIHTDLKLNDYLFHFSITNPYHFDYYYRIAHNSAATIQKL